MSGNGYETRESQGALFVNERKEGEQPDYRGNVRIGGVLYRLAGWKRTARSGTRWLALKIEPEQRHQASAELTRTPQPSRQPPTAQPARARDEFNDDIPF